LPHPYPAAQLPGLPISPDLLSPLDLPISPDLLSPLDLPVPPDLLSPQDPLFSPDLSSPSNLRPIPQDPLYPRDLLFLQDLVPLRLFLLQALSPAHMLLMPVQEHFRPFRNPR